MTIGNLTQVFVGNVANDGTGFTLRQAFITTNDNMANLYGALGNPIGSTMISNSSGVSFNTGDSVIASFDPTQYRSASYKATISSGSSYQIASINVIQNGINANSAVYGDATIGTVIVPNFTANIVSGNVLLWALSVPTSNNVVKFQTIYTTV